MEPIDIVFTWVDGEDNELNKKRQSYLTGKNKVKHNDIVESKIGQTRYNSQGEIFFSIASILRFAPFVNKIYIVTDNQNPKVDEFVAANFPDNKIPIEIIDHKVIFRGYEQYLPTFNSISIETMIYRIPGLSERFVYFNDDVILSAPHSASDWYQDDKIVVRGYYHNTMTAQLTRLIDKIKGNKVMRFRDLMLNSALMVPGMQWRFIRILHAPYVQLRSVLEDYYKEHPEALPRNLKHRFREASQFNPQVLLFTIMDNKKRCIVKNNKYQDLLYVGDANKKRRLERLNKNIEDIKTKDNLSAICVNALDQLTIEQHNRVKDYLCNLLNIKL